METPTTISHTAPSSSNNHETEETRPQAGPLPVKRGEIGYTEVLEGHRPSRSSSPEMVLPARHPADRDPEHGLPANTEPAANPPAVAGPSSSTPSLSSTIDSVAKQKMSPLLGLFKCKCKHKPPPKLGGIHLTTLAMFALQLLVFAGSIVAWVFTTRFLANMRNQNGKAPGGPSSTIFMHVVFGIAALGQVLFLERRVFRMRAERYSYLHPGEMLPSSRNQQTAPDSIIALSPWNRPPLPTYAAALAQSGAGTGDVEDHIIAQQPPPMYGNTRGSVFLLSGFLDEGLRAQRPPSIHSAASIPPPRPCSYVSRDEEWEEIQNADRARRLEETLAKLEQPMSRT